MGQEALGATGRIPDLEVFPGFGKALPGRITARQIVRAEG